MTPSDIMTAVVDAGGTISIEGAMLLLPHFQAHLDAARLAGATEAQTRELPPPGARPAYYHEGGDNCLEYAAEHNYHHQDDCDHEDCHSGDDCNWRDIANDEN